MREAGKGWFQREARWRWGEGKNVEGGPVRGGWRLGRASDKNTGPLVGDVLEYGSDCGGRGVGGGR